MTTRMDEDFGMSQSRRLESSRYGAARALLDAWALLDPSDREEQGAPILSQALTLCPDRSRPELIDEFLESAMKVDDTGALRMALALGAGALEPLELLDDESDPQDGARRCAAAFERGLLHWACREKSWGCLEELLATPNGKAEIARAQRLMDERPRLPAQRLEEHERFDEIKNAPAMDIVLLLMGAHSAEQDRLGILIDTAALGQTHPLFLTLEAQLKEPEDATIARCAQKLIEMSFAPESHAHQSLALRFAMEGSEPARALCLAQGIGAAAARRDRMDDLCILAAEMDTVGPAPSAPTPAPATSLPGLSGKSLGAQDDWLHTDRAWSLARKSDHGGYDRSSPQRTFERALSRCAFAAETRAFLEALPGADSAFRQELSDRALGHALMGPPGTIPASPARPDLARALLAHAGRPGGYLPAPSEARVKELSGKLDALLMDPQFPAGNEVCKGFERGAWETLGLALSSRFLTKARPLKL